MKALWKLVGVLIFALLTGCAGHLGTVAGAGAGAALGGPGGAVVGAVVGSMADNGVGLVGIGVSGHHRGHGGPERAKDCVPKNSDALMAWATELENPQQKRMAKVTNSNGRESCYASESGSSQSGGRRNNVGVPLPQGTGNVPVYRWTPPNSRSSQIIDLH